VSDLGQNLKSEFSDREYRYAYAESFLNTKIATQIKTLREQRHKKQSELGAAVGTKQSGFSRFEDVNHSVWKTDTLWKIARALDVRLNISFETFGSLIEEKEYFSKEGLERPEFENDPAFKSEEPAGEPNDAPALATHNKPLNLKHLASETPEHYEHVRKVAAQMMKRAVEAIQSDSSRTGTGLTTLQELAGWGGLQPLVKSSPEQATTSPQTVTFLKSGINPSGQGRLIDDFSRLTQPKVSLTKDMSYMLPPQPMAAGDRVSTNG
jgi:transcriptional regulator with XRE-family HTH domain